MPNPAKVMERIRSFGANVTLDGDKLVIVNKAKLPPNALDFVRSNAALIADFLDTEGRVEERSAIMEHDGGLPRELADHCARAMITGIPKGLSEFDRGFYIAAIGRIAEEVFQPAHELARAA